MKQSRLLSLDALRGVAAIAVLIHHAERELHCDFGFGFGYLAVDVFFLMSGFVIAGAYEPRMDARMTLLQFLKLRLARLYPMMLLGALLGIGVAVGYGTRGGTLPLAGASALLLIPLVWSGPELFPVNIPEWSIFFELVTNLIHRAIKPWLGLAALAAILATSLLLLGLAGWQLHGLANGFSPATFWGGFPRAFLSYFLGVLIHRTQPTWRPHVPTFPLPLLLAGFVALVVGESLLGGRVPASAYWLAAVTIVFPAGLMLLVAARVPAGLARIAQPLGDLSYPLYAVHMPLLLLVAPVIVPLSAPMRGLLAIATALAIAAVSLVLDRTYDRAGRTWLSRRSGAASAGVQAASAAP